MTAPLDLIRNAAFYHIRVHDTSLPTQVALNLSHVSYLEWVGTNLIKFHMTDSNGTYTATFETSDERDQHYHLLTGEYPVRKREGEPQ